MSLLTTKVNRGITPEWGKVVKSEIKLHLPFQVSDLVYKFKMIYLSYWAETKCGKYKWTDRQTHGHA